MTIKKPELKFLLRLHDDIDKGAKILGVERKEVMPNIDRFFETISLGIELGVNMKGTKGGALAVLGKSPKAKAATKSKGKARMMPERRERVLAAVKALLKNGPMRLKDITHKLGKLVSDLSDPQQGVWQMLQTDSAIGNVPKQRGFYQLKGKRSGKPKGKRKEKAVKKAATNGHVSAAAPN